MNKIISWIKKLNSKEIYTKPQRFIDLKRATSIIEFLTPGHPLYDNLAQKEEDKLRILAPNDSAFDETSLNHNFIATVRYNDRSFLVINSLKHFKEQSIGGLLQYDENIFNVIPFFETEDEYQTSYDFTFSETYEYDHPVELYTFTYHSSKNSGKISLNRGKIPITINMIDNNRLLFTQKLTPEEIEIVDYVIIPAVDAFKNIREKQKAKIS
ncbi:MAG: hypothetical protein IKW39_02000 [Alphaproteobacteria bacterium]|nr:hypothetical protein [Alphaproteobacteria bacterium]